eukprot:3841442-Rhodomonas_salina.1
MKLVYTDHNSHASLLVFQQSLPSPPACPPSWPSAAPALPRSLLARATPRVPRLRSSRPRSAACQSRP